MAKSRRTTPDMTGSRKTKKKKLALMGERRLGRVLITGASSGIGAELAREFANHGHALVLVARSKDRLDALAAELHAGHDTDSIVLPADLSNAEELVSVVETLEQRAIEIDILVNNAGIIDVGPFADAPPERLQQLIAVNIAAATALTSLFLPGMRARRFGRILNVASLAGFQPVPSMAVYAASKAYVLSFTESLAEELRGTGVSVTALCPGMTETGMVQSIRNATPAVGWAPSFLIADARSVARQGYTALMTGQTVIVPGWPNQIAATWSQMTPRWITRTVTGFAIRQANWLRREA